MNGEQARFSDDEIRLHLRHKKKGFLSMAAAGKNLNTYQILITAAEFEIGSFWACVHACRIIDRRTIGFLQRIPEMLQS